MSEVLFFPEPWTGEPVSRRRLCPNRAFADLVFFFFFPRQIPAPECDGIAPLKSRGRKYHAAKGHPERYRIIITSDGSPRVSTD